MEASKDRQWEQKGPKKVKSRPTSLTVVTVRELQVQREVCVYVCVCVRACVCAVDI